MNIVLDSCLFAYNYMMVRVELNIVGNSFFHHEKSSRLLVAIIRIFLIRKFYGQLVDDYSTLDNKMLTVELLANYSDASCV